MVKVITIRDDVYADLYRIKRPRGMSFSEVLEYLIARDQQRRGRKTDMLALAGMVSPDGIDRRLLDKMRRGF